MATERASPALTSPNAACGHGPERQPRNQTIEILERNMNMKPLRKTTGAIVAALVVAGVAPAQPARPQTPVVVSPEVKADRQVTFRISAPKAEAVGLFTSDLPS